MFYEPLKTIKVGGIFTRLTKRIMVLAIFIIILLIGVCIEQCQAISNINYLISDYDYTNQKYTWPQTWNFIKSFDNHLSYSEAEQIFRHCIIYKINILVPLARMQQEQDLIFEREGNTNNIGWRKYRCMGYGLYKNFRRDGKKFYHYGGYQIQVFRGIKLMRNAFDEWRPGIKKDVLDLKIKIKTDNAATYALYRYNPFYGKHNIYGWKYSAGGNKYFMEKFWLLKKLWGIKIAEKKTK